MEAFDEWWYKNGNEAVDKSTEHNVLVQEGWKAALEWALERLDYSGEENIVYLIERELEND